ncbi:NADP oxidoreductase coenzyme F420-dependent [Ktedonobacter racemifer DSM 44963]|uniref:NADP oxidoreductase coenzyme F420-dependent n=2 Tax=Ktedonobacter racemifer TaxID=363277 RepID=D6TQW1_KTERA|nr:NADP oxidoreductase coenzyme F420-dependent [Ktedonobacter racemifer DSM 44963]
MMTTITPPHVRLPRIAVLGAGHVGPIIARVAIEAGYNVTISASGDPEKIELIAQVLSPGAEPRRAADAVRQADIVVLALPLHKFTTLDPSLLDGKLVVDVMNYWPPVDGVQELFEDHRYGSSEIVQRRLARSMVVKTLNHIGYHELENERRPKGSPERRALGVAGDDPHAVDMVADFIERIGYDAVRFDRLSAGRLLEPGGPIFGASLHKTEFELAVRAETA